MRYLTPEQVAEQLGVSIRTVYEWLLAGRLKGLKAGRLWRIRPADLEEFMTPRTGPRREGEKP
jgi:excisionase family DNA binding protein